MNNIICLVKAEFMKVLAFKKMLLFMGIVSLLFCLKIELIPVGFMLFLYSLTYHPMSYDEKSSNIFFFGALPVNRNQIVAAKYIAFFIYIVIILVLTIGANAVFSTIRGTGIALNLYAMGGFTLAAGLAFIALVTPLVLWLGMEKAKFYSFMFYLFAYLAVSFYYNSLVVSKVDVMSVLLEIYGKFAFGAVIVLALSYILATVICSKKQYLK